MLTASQLPTPQVIDVDRSSVELLATKAEVKLKKADPIAWATLELKPPKPTASDDDDNKTQEQEWLTD